jgi:hypothetical protein
MKTHILISLFFLLIGELQGQVSMTVDENGNRIKRRIILPEEKIDPTSVLLDSSNTLSIFLQDKVEENLDSIQIIFWPNPVVDLLGIKVLGIDKVIFEVYNTEGRKIITKKSDNDNLVIDMSSLPAGTYILRLISEKPDFNWKIVKL